MMSLLLSRRGVQPLLLRARQLCSASSLVETSVDESTKIATLSMNRPPVNSLNLELCQSISAGIQEVESTKAQAMILKSNGAAFCAGLDLSELYQPDQERLKAFWAALQQVYLDLYGSKLATVACVEGAAPAAGCMLAMACDYRISTSSKKAVIGLNEAQFGIIAPPWMGDLMLKTVGHRQAEYNLMTGTLFPPELAKEIGLVDEIVSENVEDACQERAQQFAKIPPHSRATSKLLLRKTQLEHVEATRQEDLDLFLEICLADGVQKNLGAYLESLKNKSK